MGKPLWAKTNVTWGKKLEIWRRLALGDNTKNVETWLELECGHLDPDTIRKVGQELVNLPSELAAKLPLEVREYWESLTEKSLQELSQIGDKQDPHHNALWELLKKWQETLESSQNITKFLFSPPMMSKMYCLYAWTGIVNPNTAEGILMTIRRASLREINEPQDAMIVLYQQNRKRHGTLPSLNPDKDVKDHPLMPQLTEHLSATPFMEHYQKWLRLFCAYLSGFAYWSGIVSSFALIRILSRGVENGELWDGVVARLYTSHSFRQEVATLIGPTEIIMLCHLVSIALSKMEANPFWNPVMQSLESELAKAETVLMTIRSDYKVEPEEIFRELSLTTYAKIPDLHEKAPIILNDMQNLELSYATLKREMTNLLAQERLPGKCSQCK